MALEKSRAPRRKWPGLAAPAAADLEVLPVDVPVGVDRGWPDVGVVPGDHVPAAVARERQALLDRRAAPAASRTTSALRRGSGRGPARGVRRRGVEVQRVVRAHPHRHGEAITRRPDGDDRRGAAQPRERDGAEADRARPLHDHAVAGPERRAFEYMHGREQAAAAADVIVEADGVRAAWRSRRQVRGRSPAPSRRTAPRTPNR
jgi:hypothetical protein